MTQPWNHGDWNQFRVGGVTQPLPVQSGNSLLRDADPAIFFALDFWSYVINTYPGPRLVAAAAAIKLAKTFSAAVDNTYPYEPLPDYLELQINLPALFAYRRRGRSEQWTAGHDHDITEIEVDYVLPPLDAAAAEALLPILPAIFQAIRRKTNDGWDPGYTPPGGVAGDLVWSAAFANLEEIGFGTPVDKRVASAATGWEFGRLAGTGNIWFPALIMRGYMIERDEYAPTIGGPSQFLGADITGNVKAGDGTVVAATASTVVQASTYGPPTISGLSSTNYTSQLGIKDSLLGLSMLLGVPPQDPSPHGISWGGTTVKITGTGFLPGPPVVYFGPASAPQYAPLVLYNGPTSLTVVTPPMQGPGVVDLTIVNRDGQQVRLPAAFTFN